MHFEVATLLEALIPLICLKMFSVVVEAEVDLVVYSKTFLEEAVAEPLRGLTEMICESPCQSLWNNLLVEWKKKLNTLGTLRVQNVKVLALQMAHPRVCAPLVAVLVKLPPIKDL